MNHMDEKFNKGCLAFERKKIEDALRIFNDILEENPEYYPAINKVGVIYAKKNELDTAKMYFERVLDIQEDYAPALVNIGNILKEEGDIANAEKYYLYSITCDPDYYIAYYNLSVLYKNINQYDLYIKYIKSYKKSYKKYINNKETQLYRNEKSKKIYTLSLIFIAGIIILFLCVLNS